MKLSYEPNLAAGGVMGALMALAVYYKILDWEAAGLWSVVIAGVAPIVQGYVARFFTTPTAKLTDAGIYPDSVDAAAKEGRRARHAVERSGGPATSRGSHLPPR